MSETSSEGSFRAAEADLAEADRSGDHVRIASAQVRWADAAELWADDLDRGGHPVPDGLRRRVARFRKDTAAG